MFTPANIFTQSASELDHNRLIALINSLNDAFLAINNDGVIELSNSHALNLLDVNSLEGKSISDVMRLADPSGHSVEVLDLVKSSQKGTTSRDFCLNNSTANPINIYLSISSVRSGYDSSVNGTSGYVLVFRDITSEKIQEQERDEFISVASHEMRSPVAIVEGSISNAMLIAKQNNVSETVIHILESAHNQINFLGSLINDLAMLSRAEQGQAMLSTEQVDISKLVNSLKHDYQPQAELKGLVLNADIAPAIPVFFSNQLYIREILQNFITNSIKYTEIGSVSLKISADAAGVTFSVSDTGAGIDDIEKSKLFSKFFRSEDPKIRKHSGTGLGLYISNKLAHLIGGSIGVQSHLAHGSTFSLFIPHRQALKSKLPKTSR